MAGVLEEYRALIQRGELREDAEQAAAAAQLDALKTAMGQIDVALPTVRALNAENGRKQAETESLGTRADERANLLSELISTNEDADYGQIASDLSQQQTVLRASYSVFTQLSSLSLTQYLK